MEHPMADGSIGTRAMVQMVHISLHTRDESFGAQGVLVHACSSRKGSFIGSQLGGWFARCGYCGVGIGPNGVRGSERTRLFLAADVARVVIYFVHSVCLGCPY